KRELGNLHKPHHYWVKEQIITFDTEKRIGGGIDLGQRVKELRTRKGLSQTELAHLVGVTPSTVSQIESNMIYPSLPGLVKMAEILSVEVSAFFQGKSTKKKRFIFSPQEALPIKFSNFPEGSIQGKMLTSADLETKAEPFLIEIPPNTTLSDHFFIHKGEELGYLLSGELRVKFKKGAYSLHPGEIISLPSEIPVEWKNPGTESARLLWIKIK
ncbi:MAG: XRE family transcriptional regulator, partial [Desulfobacca sp.]|nr:XRE family transcriptional regulator [Desulfobacca sp.]